MPLQTSYDPGTLYNVTLSERIEVPELRITLYPGRRYQVRGDLLAQHADKVLTAEQVV